MTDEREQGDERPDADDPSDEEAFQWWWAHLPDFIKPGYPFDLPPDRLPYARFLFTEIGAPRFCPETACRKAGECVGEAGPPCFRADRRPLGHALFITWLRMFYGMTEEEFRRSFEARAGRYTWDEKAPPVRGRRPRRRSRPARLSVDRGS